MKFKGTLSSLRPNGGLESVFVIPKDISLLPGAMYLFRVICKSNNGSYHEALPNTLCRTLPGVPDTPTNFESFNITPHGLSVKWIAGSRNGSKAFLYRIEHKKENPNGDNAWNEGQPKESKQAPATTTTTSKICTVTFEHLEPAQNYLFRACAENDAGIGEWSNTYTISTRPLPPSKPQPPYLISSTAMSIHFQWEPAKEAAEEEQAVAAVAAKVAQLHPPPPLIYVVEAKQASNVHGPFQTIYRGPKNDAHVHHLLPSTAYAFRVYAISSLSGISVPSNVALLETSISVPLALTSPTVNKIQSHSINVRWNTDEYIASRRGSNNGTRRGSVQTAEQAAPSTVDSYRLECTLVTMNTDLNDENTTVEKNHHEQKTFETKETEHTITSLTPGTTYHLRICSHNSAGWSQWSVPTIVRTNNAVPSRPSPPKILSSKPGKVHLSWKDSVPNCNGSKINRYQLIARLAEGTVVKRHVVQKKVTQPKRIVTAATIKEVEMEMEMEMETRPW